MLIIGETIHYEGYIGLLEKEMKNTEATLALGLSALTLQRIKKNVAKLTEKCFSGGSAR